MCGCAVSVGVLKSSVYVQPAFYTTEKLKGVSIRFLNGTQNICQTAQVALSSVSLPVQKWLIICH